MTAPGGASRPHGALAALVCVQVLFGLHYLAAKVVVAEIPPASWALMRAGSAAVLLLLAVAARGIRLPLSGPSLARFAGLALIGVALNQWLFVEGISRTTPAHSALINASIPVLVLLIAVLLRREKLSAGRLAGIATTLCGVLILTGRHTPGQETGSAIGDLLSLCNAASYSLFLVLGKPVFERERTLPATTLLMSAGTLWLLPVGLPGLVHLRAAEIAPATWGLAAFIVLGPTIGAYVLNTYALRRLESSLVAFFVYLQPVLGAGLSIALGLEQPTRRLFVSGAIVFLGIFIALRARPRAQRGRATPTAPRAFRNRGTSDSGSRGP